MHTYIPNDYAKELFNLSKNAYEGDSLTDLIMQAIGEDNYDQYIHAQDPLCGGRLSGEIFASVNRDDIRKAFDECLNAPLPAVDCRSIGMVYTLKP